MYLWCVQGSLSICVVDLYHTVRRYVQAMKDPGQLLDLLAAEGSHEIEPTRASGSKQALYPDVSHAFLLVCTSH